MQGGWGLKRGGGEQRRKQEWKVHGLPCSLFFFWPCAASFQLRCLVIPETGEKKEKRTDARGCVV